MSAGRGGRSCAVVQAKLAPYRACAPLSSSQGDGLEVVGRRSKAVLETALGGSLCGAQGPQAVLGF